MQKWEYTCIFWDGPKIWIGTQVVTSDKNAVPLTYMQQLGNEGWEMVAAVSESVSMGGIPTEKWGGIRWYFKRPKP